MENIGLQDSLLSRFDLLFVMLDTVENDQDRRISDFVVRMHRYRNPKEQEGDVLPMGGSFADMLSTFSLDVESEVRLKKFFFLFFKYLFSSFFKNKETPLYEPYDPLLHGESRSAKERILSVQFMRKYIHFAKILKPKLTNEASEVIANEYSRLRSQDLVESDVARTQPVTPRTLETLIRLSTAHAKARLSKTITVVDANAAIELIQFAYFKRVLEKEKKKRRRSEVESDDEAVDSDTETREDGEAARRSKRTRTEPADHESDDENFQQPVDSGDLTRRESRRTTQGEPSTSSAQTPQSSDGIPAESIRIDSDRLKLFQQKVYEAFRAAREQSLPLANLQKSANEQNSEPFSAGEIKAAINQMTDANQIMMADDIVFLI